MLNKTSTLAWKFDAEEKASRYVMITVNKLDEPNRTGLRERVSSLARGPISVSLTTGFYQINQHNCHHHLQDCHHGCSRRGWTL